ncbi:MAG: hypothetical protein NVSMB56_07360 [Pyrinomonadaceae bacterium]
MHLKIPVITSNADDVLHFNDNVWQRLTAFVCARHQIAYTALRRSTQCENIRFFVDEFVVKIYTWFREGFILEKATLD